MAPAPSFSTPSSTPAPLNGSVSPEYQEARSLDDRPKEFRESKESSVFTPKAYISKEAPLSLGQMQHIAPKPFKRMKDTINLGEVRKILSSERTGSGEVGNGKDAENASL
jgi:hypothetical protein